METTNNPNEIGYNPLSGTKQAPTPRVCSKCSEKLGQYDVVCIKCGAAAEVTKAPASESGPLLPPAAPGIASALYLVSGLAIVGGVLIMLASGGSLTELTIGASGIVSGLLIGGLGALITRLDKAVWYLGQIWMDQGKNR